MERISSARRPVSIRVQFPVATEANVPPLVTLLPIAAFRITKLDPGTLRVFKRGCSRSIVFKV